MMTSTVCGSALSYTLPVYAASTSDSMIVPDVNYGEAISEKLNEALLTAAEMADDDHRVTVRLPEGTYILDGALHIYSNTILDVTGCTLISDENKHNLFILGTNSSYMGIAKYNSSEQSKGYMSVRNVTVRGGVWEGNDKNTNTPIRLAHATNVTFENMTVRGANMSTHQVEAAGIDGFFVRNCTFCDFTPLSYKNGHFEAIQLDVPINTAIYNSSYLDGTPNNNVEITGCTFSNVSRGVGTHSMLVGAYHTNVRITDNTFVNVQEEAIVALNYLDCRISGNKIVKCGGGRLFESAKFKPSSDTNNKISSMHTTVFDGQQEYVSDIIYDMHSTIFDNDIDIAYSPLCSRMIGIRVHGLELDEQYVGGDDMPLPINNYYISGVNISNNRITTQGGGILLDDARDIICRSNTVKQTSVNKNDKRADAYDGIYITSGCQDVSVTDNTVSGFTRHGILVAGESAAGTILGNKVSGCTKHGIYITGSSATYIKCNTVKSCGGCGIALGSNSTVTEIESNTLTSCGGNAVYITGSSKVTGSIRNNNIEKSAVCGIALNGSKAGSIEQNTIVAPASYGVYVSSGSSVSGKIGSNSISESGASGVVLDGGSAVRTITSNKVNSSGSNGIYLTEKSKVKGAITNNTVNKTVQNGISLTSGSSADSISSNNVSTSGKNGIFVYTSSNVSKAITGNTVKGVKKNGILLDNSSGAKTISSNNIKSSGQNGIYLYNKSKLDGDITGNTVNGSKQSGIAIDRSSSSTNLVSNKISTSGKNGIYLYGSSKTVGISQNTVKSSKRTGIALGKKCSVKSISQNTVTSSKESGISLLDKSKATGNIKKNKITSAKTGIYADKSSKVKGKVTGNKFDKIDGKKTDIKK